MILFKKLRYKNILSTGNAFTEIDLSKNSSTLIIGENGAGKSTMLDALTFALYGKPFRKINKNQLMNTINNRDLVVEVVFKIGQNTYTIKRGIKPALFEVWKNDEMLNQDAAARDYQIYLEQNILKMNMKSFGQVVVLGSSTFVPFMQLTAQARREVIEDLLDIQIFTTMNLLLKERVSENKQSIQELKYAIDIKENSIESAKTHNDSIRDLRKEEIQKILAKIQSHEREIVLWEQKVSEHVADIETLTQSITDIKSVNNKASELSKLESTLLARVSAISKELKFYEDHDNCPTCKQGIEHEFKETTVESRMGKKAEIEDGLSKLKLEVESTAKRIKEISETQGDIHHHNVMISECRANIQVNTTAKKSLVSELKAAKESAEAIDESKIKQLNDELSQLHEDQNTKYDEKENLSVVSSMLKDGGIKTRIIKQYVPIMNKLINKYLASMEFFVQFELDESFNEKIKSRFRDEFSYSSFSEGEKLRIDLALLFTWRAVSKLRNSVSTNLLIMDEIMDSSLDSAGTEEFLKILNELTVDSNVFIISHKGDQLFDKFDNVIRFEKHKNFSRVAA